MVIAEYRLKSPVMELCIRESIHCSFGESPLPVGSRTARLIPFPPSPVQNGADESCRVCVCSVSCLAVAQAVSAKTAYTAIIAMVIFFMVCSLLLGSFALPFIISVHAVALFQLPTWHYYRSGQYAKRLHSPQWHDQYLPYHDMHFLGFCNKQLYSGQSL